MQRTESELNLTDCGPGLLMLEIIGETRPQVDAEVCLRVRLQRL
jgi:hypothetical protein